MIKYGKDKKFSLDVLHPLNIDRQSVTLIPEGSKILEIGCATGFMAEYLIKEKKCIVDGVELALDEAREAKKKLRNVITGDIEDKDTIKQIEDTYDIVFASALIEHLKDPWLSLKTWKKVLKKDGRILITTSNIAHWSMRLKMMKGQFNYEQYGILDNTHLRFFTTESFQKLVTDCGYTIEHFSIDPVGGGYPKISKLLSHTFPNLFAYQMLIFAKPN